MIKRLANNKPNKTNQQEVKPMFRGWDDITQDKPNLKSIRRYFNNRTKENLSASQKLINPLKDITIKDTKIKGGKS